MYPNKKSQKKNLMQYTKQKKFSPSPLKMQGIYFNIIPETYYVVKMTYKSA